MFFMSDVNSVARILILEYEEKIRQTSEAMMLTRSPFKSKRFEKKIRYYEKILRILKNKTE